MFSHIVVISSLLDIPNFKINFMLVDNKHPSPSLKEIDLLISLKSKLLILAKLKLLIFRYFHKLVLY
jgi:hypothetical protein